MRPDLTIDTADLSGTDAIEVFGRAGCLKLRNFAAPERVAVLRDVVAEMVATSACVGQSVQVGTQRHMLPVPISKNFDCPDIYASAELGSFLSSVLGEKYVLSCVTCVNAAAGAPEQHVHRDYEGLFDDKIDSFCPSFAINLFVPLVAFNERNGSTRLWPGSHRKPDTENDAAVGDHVDAELELGSALLVDYRLRHGGTANNSNKDRPLLCLAFSRDWFVDTQNFRTVDPLQIEAERLERMSPAIQHLFSRATLYHELKTS